MYTTIAVPFSSCLHYLMDISAMTYVKGSLAKHYWEGSRVCKVYAQCQNIHEDVNAYTFYGNMLQNKEIYTMATYIKSMSKNDVKFK